MPGHPFQDALIVRIGEKGGWSPIFDRLANGETQASIAKDYGCSRNFLSFLLNNDPERRALLHASRKEAAHALTEEALQLADGVPENRNAIAKVKIMMEQRNKMAASYDREFFGQSKEGTTINIGSLHLEALKAKREEFQQIPHSLPVGTHAG